MLQASAPVCQCIVHLKGSLHRWLVRLQMLIEYLAHKHLYVALSVCEAETETETETVEVLKQACTVRAVQYRLLNPTCVNCRTTTASMGASVEKTHVLNWQGRVGTILSRRGTQVELRIGQQESSQEGLHTAEAPHTAEGLRAAGEGPHIAEEGLHTAEAPHTAEGLRTAEGGSILLRRPMLLRGSVLLLRGSILLWRGPILLRRGSIHCVCMRRHRPLRRIKDVREQGRHRAVHSRLDRPGRSGYLATQRRAKRQRCSDKPSA